MDFNRYFASRRGELLNTLKKVVAFESPTSDKKAVDACAAFVIGEFRKTGAKITRPQKDIGDLHIIEYAPEPEERSGADPRPHAHRYRLARRLIDDAVLRPATRSSGPAPSI
jgi:hypothetical protein